MARIVALLRGVNVGGHRRVPMADLRELCRGLGFADVESFIQSGNLVFTAAGGAAEAASSLEGAIVRRFGFPVDVVARSAEQWARLVAGNPFPAASEREPGRVALLLCKAPPRPGGAEALAACAAAGERVEASGDAVWVHFPAGMGRSKLSPARIDRLLGSPATARNWRTVLSLRALATAGRARASEPGGEAAPGITDAAGPGGRGRSARASRAAPRGSGARRPAGPRP